MTRKSAKHFSIAIVALACCCLNDSLRGETVPQAEAEQVCVIADERIMEASGLALSRRQPDAIWIHNDSGDIARLFIVGLDGETRGVVRLADVPMPVDWEDMCSFTVNGEPWLLIGDVGDNAINRHIVTPDTGEERACRLLLLPEPALKPGPEQESVPVHTAILFEYEDGPRNCESVAVDTERKEILLVSKSKSTPLDCGMYCMPLTLQAGTCIATARRIGSLDLPFATAMDVAPGNRRLVIISSRGAAIVDRETDEHWGDAIKKGVRLFALPKRENGETVCFGQSTGELFLNSEQAKQPLWRVRIPAL
ncbi:MAG: hypothetical protein IT364_26285 [Candidatus Hydrogenedentes bacterium]|nr:hypothetical protein [Candidatus Hydrogenedentota bacterium]